MGKHMNTKCENAHLNITLTDMSEGHTNVLVWLIENTFVGLCRMILNGCKIVKLFSFRYKIYKFSSKVKTQGYLWIGVNIESSLIFYFVPIDENPLLPIH